MAITNDLQIRLIAQDRLSTALANVADTINKKTEPALKMIKQNLVTLDNRITNNVNKGGKLNQVLANTANVTNNLNIKTSALNNNIRATANTSQQAASRISSLADSFSQFARTFSFTGFILSATFRRINSAALDFTKAMLNMVLGLGNVDKAFSFLEDSLVALAMGGDLTVEKTDEIIKKFWDFYTASTDLGSNLAALKVKIQPFITVLAEVAAEGIGEIVSRIEELEREGKLDEVLENWREAASVLKDRLVAAVIYLIDHAPELSEKLIKLADGMGAFIAGLTKEKIDNIILAVNTISDLVSPENMEKLGALSGFMENLGIAMTILGSPIMLLGIGLKMLAGPLELISSNALTTKGVLFSLKTAIGLLTPYVLPLTAAFLVLYFAWDDICKIWSERLGPSLGSLLDSLNKIVPITETFNALAAELPNLIGFIDAAISGLVATAMSGLTWLVDTLTNIVDLIGWVLGKGKPEWMGESKSNAGLNVSGFGTDAPLYSNPEEFGGGRQLGGLITSAGLYKLHVGERVVSEPIASGKIGGGGSTGRQTVYINNNINVGNISSEMDLDYVRSEVSTSIANAAMRLGYMGRGR